MIFAMIASATATLSRALWSRHAPRSGFSVGTVVVLAPSFALFGYSSLISAQGARTASVTAYLAAALVFVVAGDAATAPVGGGDGATGPSGGRRSFGGGVVGLAALGVVVGPALLPGLGFCCVTGYWGALWSVASAPPPPPL